MSKTFTNHMVVDFADGVRNDKEGLRKLGLDGWVILCPYPYNGPRSFVVVQEYTLTVGDVVRRNQPTGRARGRRS